jgi:(S)-sulfolactate dehydrogenase
MRAAVAIRSLQDNPYFAEKSNRLFREVDYLPARPDASELKRLLAQYDVLIIGARERITAEMLGQDTLRTQVVGTLSVGTDHLDMVALAARGVYVERCPTANVRSVAEHALTLILALTKHIKVGDRLIAEGKSRSDMPGLPREVQGKTLGLIGFGNIGQTVAGLGHAFGMKVVATSPSRQSGADGYVRFGNLEYVLEHSDFISISVPLTQSTVGLVNRHTLALAKDGLILVNTSRAEVEVEADISAALDTGKLGGYGGDYDGASSDMAKRPNVILTPHIAGITVESNDRLDNELIDRLEAHFAA